MFSSLAETAEWAEEIERQTTALVDKNKSDKCMISGVVVSSQFDGFVSSVPRESSDMGR
jgi:hypothetical protein